MYKANALTDAIGLVIAVSFALQTAIGPGLSNLVELLTLRMSNRVARLVTICCGGIFGGMLGLVAWQNDGNRGWVAMGVLAGLLAGAGQRLSSGAVFRIGSGAHQASWCNHPSVCMCGVEQQQAIKRVCPNRRRGKRKGRPRRAAPTNLRRFRLHQVVLSASEDRGAGPSHAPEEKPR